MPPLFVTTEFPSRRNTSGLTRFPKAMPNPNNSNFLISTCILKPLTFILFHFSFSLLKTLCYLSRHFLCFNFTLLGIYPYPSSIRPGVPVIFCQFESFLSRFFPLSLISVLFFLHSALLVIILFQFLCDDLWAIS